MEISRRRRKRKFHEKILTPRSKNDTSSSLFVFLMYQIQLGQIEVLKSALRLNPEVTSVKTRHGLQLLHVAAQEGYPSTLAVLAQTQTPNVNIPDFFGYSPLIYAVWNGHVMTVDLLLKANADPNFCTQSHGWTPLFYATYAAHQNPHEKCILYKQIVKQLLRTGANPNACDHDGWTPLFYCDQTCLVLAKTLVKRGANLSELEHYESHRSLYDDPGLSCLFDYRLQTIRDVLDSHLTAELIEMIIELSLR